MNYLLNAAIEILVTISLSILALWLIFRAHVAAKRSENLSLASWLKAPDPARSFNDLFYAAGFVFGLIIVSLLLAKLL